MKLATRENLIKIIIILTLLQTTNSNIDLNLLMRRDLVTF